MRGQKKMSVDRKERKKEGRKKGRKQGGKTREEGKKGGRRRKKDGKKERKIERMLEKIVLYPPTPKFSGHGFRIRITKDLPSEDQQVGKWDVILIV